MTILTSVAMSRQKSVLSGQKSLPTAAIQVLGDENAMSVSALILVEPECHYQNLYIKLIANWVDCSTTSTVWPDIISVVFKLRNLCCDSSLLSRIHLTSSSSGINCVDVSRHCLS